MKSLSALEDESTGECNADGEHTPRPIGGARSLERQPPISMLRAGPCKVPRTSGCYTPRQRNSRICRLSTVSPHLIDGVMAATPEDALNEAEPAESLFELALVDECNGLLTHPYVVSHGLSLIRRRKEVFSIESLGDVVYGPAIQVEPESLFEMFFGHCAGSVRRSDGFVLTEGEHIKCFGQFPAAIVNSITLGRVFVWLLGLARVQQSFPFLGHTFRVP